MALTPKDPSAISPPEDLVSANESGVSIPATVTPKPEGSISAPDDVTAKPEGSVGVPNTTTSKAAGTVSAPENLTTQAEGSVSAPATLTTEPVGDVSAPVTLTSEAAATISTPDNVPAVSAGSVAVPVSLATQEPNAIPRALTARLDMDFSNDLYAVNGSSVSFDDVLTYSRNSSATYIDRKVVNGVPQFFLNTDYVGSVQNLALWSESFDNAAWIKTDAITKDGAKESPNGTRTASLVTVAVKDAPRVRQVITAALNKACFSVWVKADGSSAGRVGSVVLYRDSLVDYTSRNFVFTGEWQRVDLQQDFSATSSSVSFRVDFDLPASPSNIGDTFYIWGAQLVTGTKPLPYVKTTSTTETKTFTESPRIEWDAETGEKLGVLVEPTSTNLFTKSERFDDTAWVKISSTVLSSAVSSPDLTFSGDLLSDTSSDTSHYIRSLVAGVPNTTYTVSIMVKAKDNLFVYLLVNEDTISGNNAICFIDSVTGVIGSSSDAGDFSVVRVKSGKLGSGWSRLELTFTTGSMLSSTDIFARIGLAAADGVTNYIGDGSGVYIWGAQLEQQPAATSYIRTDATTETRLSDDITAPAGLLANMTNFSMSAVIDISHPVNPATFDRRVFDLDGNQGSAFAFIGQQSFRHIYGGPAINSTFNQLIPNEQYRYTLSYNYQSSNLANYVDGIKYGEGLQTTVFELNPEGVIKVGEYLGGHISKMTFYDAALTDTEVSLL